MELLQKRPCAEVWLFDFGLRVSNRSHATENKSEWVGLHKTNELISSLDHAYNVNGSYY